MAVGVALRCWQYGAGASIWVDEATIARNILDRDLAGLVARPLDYGQFAPPLFLALVEACTHMFGLSEWSFRLVPFAAGVAALPVFLAFARRMLPPAAAVAATLLVALAVPLILFSANVKQYAPDVLALLGIGLLAARHVDAPLDPRRAVLLIVAGLLAVGISSGVVFMLVPAGALLAWSTIAWRERVRGGWCLADDWRTRLAVVAGWAVTAMAAVAWSSQSTTAVGRTYMDLYWARGFVPWELSRIPEWLWTSLQTEFGGTGGPYSGTLKYPAEPLIAALFIAGGLVTLWRRRAEEIALLLGPVALALAGAAAAVYPFRGRVILFLVPLLLIVVVRGAVSIAGLAAGRYAAHAALALVPIAVYALWQNPLPQDQQRMREVMAYVHAQAKPGDRAWVYYGAGPAYGYYSHLFPVPATVSDCDRADSRSQIAQVDRLRGAPRVWVIVSHAGDDAVTDERTPLLEYLDTIGERLDTFPRDFAPSTPLTASAAFLYRLDDRERLGRASVATFQVARSRRPAWGCFGGMTYDERDMARAADAVLAAAR